MTNQIPSITPEQRAEALIKAAEVRAARAELRKLCKAGVYSFAEAIERPEAQRMKVYTLIVSMPGYGKAKADRVMDAFHISKTRRVQGLGSKQKASLLALFAEKEA